MVIFLTTIPSLSSSTNGSGDEREEEAIASETGENNEDASATDDILDVIEIVVRNVTVHQSEESSSSVEMEATEIVEL
ncbi:hypothetical protein Fmac_006661 [Flemingia macrophylla]|uniref:Uncharacterized protein n=1 Tax=Flemingia macrophylla TaxID=520843 RepID=A0ABD1NBS9_9FABA